MKVRAVLGAVLSALGVLGLWLAFVTTTRGQALDQSALQGAVVLAGLDAAAKEALSVVSEASLALAAAALACVALVRRRWRAALAALVVVGGSNVTTQLLKHVVLERPDLVAGGANSLPSGHTTVAASLVVAAVLVLGRGRLVAAWLGSALAAGAGFATLVASWHRPSDVLAAYLVVLAWAWVARILVGEGATRRSRLLLGVALLASVGSVGAGVVLSMDGGHAWAFAAGTLGCAAGAALGPAVALRSR